MSDYTNLAPMTLSEAREVTKVPLGQTQADLAVVNANVLNVYSGEILPGQTVCTKGRWIAYVGSEPGGSIGEETEIVDARDKTVIPGLIDGHTHMAYLTRPDEFLRYVMPGGTTTLITEGMEPYPVSGYAGLLDFLQSVQEQPIKVYATAPAMVSISPAFQGISQEDLEKLLEMEQILGLGESYWQSVIQEPDTYLPAFVRTRQARKTLEGHTAGASDKKLAAYTAAGITSCHEPIKWEEALQRLRLGMHVMIREGGVRKDLQAIAQIKDQGVDLRRLVLATDSIAPEELLKSGYMEKVVQKAIQCGFEPVTAIRMATLNVAEHFHLDDLIGGIAPGRFADMLIIPDIHNIEAEYVLSNGRIIARKGELLVQPRRHNFSAPHLNSIHLQHRFEASDFSIAADGGKTKVLTRVMEMLSPLVTAETHLELPVEAGQIKAVPEQDILKVAAVDRRNTPGKTFTGLLKGFGLSSGAVASSAAWDTSDIIVLGADDQSMAEAVNRIYELQGGTVIWNKGSVVQEIPLPIFGIISEFTLEEVTRRSRKMKDAFASLGVKHPDPILSLVTLTGAAIPFLRICEQGLVNLKDGQIKGLFVD